MKENEFKSNDLKYADENTDPEEKIIYTKRKIINVDIEVQYEYFISKKSKNNTDNENNVNKTV